MDYQEGTAIMIHSVQERLELTGSNHSTSSILLLIWFLHNSPWSICHWEMSGAFVPVSHRKFGWGAGYQLKMKVSIGPTTQNSRIVSSMWLTKDHSDLRNIPGDQLCNMAGSVMGGVCFEMAPEAGLFWCYLKSFQDEVKNINIYM